MTGRPSSDVDDEDRQAEHPGDPGEQARELGQPALELGLRMTLAEPGRDPSELRVNRPVATTTASAAPSCTTVPMKSARRQLGQRLAGRLPGPPTSPPAPTRR